MDNLVDMIYHFILLCVETLRNFIGMFKGYSRTTIGD